MQRQSGNRKYKNVTESQKSFTSSSYNPTNNTENSQINLGNKLMSNKNIRNETSRIVTNETTLTSSKVNMTKKSQPVTSSGRRNVKMNGFTQKREDGKLVIIEQVPVFKEIIQEVPYDVIIERPVEVRIENRYYVDKEIEVIREIVKEVPKIIEVNREKIIEVEEYVDEEEFIENYVDVVNEVIKVVEVPNIIYQDKIVEKNVEVLKVRPHRVDVKENVIYKDKVNVVDQYVTKDNIIETNVYVEASTGQRVHNYQPGQKIEMIEDIIEEPYDVYVDNITTINKEVPYDVIKNVDNITIKKVPVERVEVHTEYYDDIKIVEVPVERIVDMPVEKTVMVDKYVDKDVVKEVEVIVPVPKHIERIVNRVVDVPFIKEVIVEIPYEKIVENRTETYADVMVPEMTVSNVNVEYTDITETNVQEDLEVEFDVEKIVETEVHTKEEVPVDYMTQVFKTNTVQESYDKNITMNKTIEKSNVRKSIRDIDIQKNVQLMTITENPIFQESMKVVTNDKMFDVNETNETVQYNEVVENMEMRSELKTTRMTRRQKNDLGTVSSDTSRIQLENLKLRTNIETYESQISQIRGMIVDEETLAKNRVEYKQKLINLEDLIRACQTETRDIEMKMRQMDKSNVNVENIEVYSENEIKRIEDQIKEVENRNKKLRELLGKVNIRSSRVGSMSSTSVRNSTKVSREVEAKMASYERDPNAKVTYGQKMVNSIYVEKNKQASQGGVKKTSHGGYTSSTNQGGYTSSTNQGGYTTSTSSQGVQKQYQTNGQGYYGNSGQNMTSKTSHSNTSQSRTVKSSTSTMQGRSIGGNGGFTSTTTKTESYTNSTNPKANYNNNNTYTTTGKFNTNTPIISRNVVRDSKVIKESPQEWGASTQSTHRTSNNQLFHVSSKQSHSGRVGGSYNQGRTSSDVRTINGPTTTSYTSGSMMGGGNTLSGSRIDESRVISSKTTQHRN